MDGLTLDRGVELGGGVVARAVAGVLQGAVDFGVVGVQGLGLAEEVHREGVVALVHGLAGFAEVVLGDGLAGLNQQVAVVLLSGRGRGGRRGGRGAVGIAGRGGGGLGGGGLAGGGRRLGGGLSLRGGGGLGGRVGGAAAGLGDAVGAAGDAAAVEPAQLDVGVGDGLELGVGLVESAGGEVGLGLVEHPAGGGLVAVHRPQQVRAAGAGGGGVVPVGVDHRGVQRDRRGGVLGSDLVGLPERGVGVKRRGALGLGRGRGGRARGALGAAGGGGVGVGLGLDLGQGLVEGLTLLLG